MSKVWLQLGRAGDIMTVLPLLWKDAQDGKRWKLMIAAEYAGLLDGVSYVDPLIYSGPHHELAMAHELAAKEGTVLATQVNGPADQVLEHVYKPCGQVSARATSFQKEMWRVAGRLKEWDECYPLVFDRRSTDRETELNRSLGLLKPGKQKRLMLVSMTGNTSPFPYVALLMELLKGRFGGTHRILELPRCERIYDLLTLYERAQVMVAIDSAPLHLARAVPSLPVIALVNDKPSLWNGSSWAPNHRFYCRYGDFVSRAVEMLDAIDKIHSHSTAQTLTVHVWSEYQEKRTAPTPLGWFPLPVTPGMCGRDSTVEKDEKRIPYLKDCVRMGLQKGFGFVCVTHPQAQFESSEEVLKHDACFAYRISRDGDKSGFQPTVDLFCAKKSWWKEHLEEIPDYLLGTDYWWTHGLRALFSKYGAKDVTGAVSKTKATTVAGSPNAMPPRIKHNKDLANDYVLENRICCRYPRVTEQVEVVASFTHMTRFGYNPTIAEHDGKIWMCYRYHPDPNIPTTKLELAELSQDGLIVKTRPLDIAGDSIEDPRFFKAGDRLAISWVDSTGLNGSPKSVVRYGIFTNGILGEFHRPELPGNDGATVQKNYVIFEHPSTHTAYCIYQSSPHRIFERRPEWFELPNPDPPKWDYGTIRGGTPPMPYDGKMLRFFHGNLDNEFGPQPRRYYVGAMVMEPEPPFKVLRVSRRPILYGSEIDNIKVKNRPPHWKSRVIFPGGAFQRDGGFWVACGVNDSSCVIVKIRERDLQL